jgi:hypothetical protein
LAAQGGVGGGGGGCLSDQESLASMSISVSRVNGSSCGLTTPTCGLPGHPGLLSGHHGYNSMGLLPGDRGSCSADSGVRGSSDRESGGATSGGGNLSDSTTDGKQIKIFHTGVNGIFGPLIQSPNVTINQKSWLLLKLVDWKQ